MSQVRSIFARRRRVVLPERETPLMRVLEPRVLLDAAALETALDVAAQAVHSDLAEAYLSPEAQARPIGERTPFAVHRSAAFEGLNLIVREDADDDAAASADASPDLRELVFVDGKLPDLDALLAGIDPAAEVHVIDPDTDGVLFMAQILEEADGVDALHIMSHGSRGTLRLGSAVLDAGSPDVATTRALAAMRDALSAAGDIMVYGCDFGAGADGERAAAMLAAATGADVAASVDLTGNASLGGDWDLELSVGTIEARALRIESFSGVLADQYAIAVVSAPEVTHPEGDPLGSLYTVVRYRDAVTLTPEGGGAPQTFDLVGQFIGFTGDVSVAFTAEGDDLGITINNVGPVDPDTGLSAPGAATIAWYVDDPDGLGAPALGAIDLTVDGLFGAGAAPDTGTGVSVDLSNLSAYTLDPSTQLITFVNGDEDTLSVFGGAPADATGDRDQASFNWNNTSGLIMSYHTREASSLFRLDGDRDLTFAAGTTTATRVIDADGSTPGIDFAVDYVNADSSGGNAEAGVRIVDTDLTIFDINNTRFYGATVTLENARAGDRLIYDATLASDLKLVVTLDDSGADTVLRIAAQDDIEGALKRNYEDFLRSIVFRADAPDATLDRSARTILTTFTDGVDEAPAATTTISFVDDADAVTATPVVEAVAEDGRLTRNAATGLLSQVSNPGGNTLAIAQVLDSNGDAVSFGQPYATPAGATLNLLPDGSFDYQPGADISGTETFTVSISDGAGSTIETALILNVTPEADLPTLTLTLPSASTLEDAPTAVLNVAAATVDPSETLSVVVAGLPDGVIVEDAAGNSYRFDPDEDFGEEDSVDVTDWDLPSLRVLPFEDSDADLTFRIIARATEEDGSYVETSQEVTVEIDAVADKPLLVLEAAIAPVDGVADLGGAMRIELRDTDGSEVIGEIRIADIKQSDGLTFFVDGTARTVDFSDGVNDGFLVLTLADIGTLTMEGPNDGEQHGYRFQVTAEAIELTPDGNIAVARAIAGPVPFNVAFDNSDDPVDAVPDVFDVAAGEATEIDVLDNDVALDGGLEIIQINGVAISETVPYVFATGEGRLTLNGSGNLTFVGAPGFSGTLVFEYGVRDSDFDFDSATVVLNVDPRWNVQAPSGEAPEGGTLDFSLYLEGSLRAGESASVVPALVYGSATPSDVGDLDTAINDAIAGNANFSFDGTRLTFTSPLVPYDVNTRSEPALVDIGATGTAVDVSAGPAPVTLPFSFRFNGASVTDLHVMEGGFLSLDGPQASGPNGTLDGTAFGGDRIIAPWWDEIDVTNGGVTSLVEGDPGARTATIQWTGVPAGGANQVTFQAVLFEANGRIEFRYLDVDDGGPAAGGASATIGLQGNGIGTPFSENTAGVSDGTVVRLDPASVGGPGLLIRLSVTDDPDFELAETVSLAISDAQGSSIGTLEAEGTIAYSDNTAPVANDDAVSTPKNAPVTIDVVSGTQPGVVADTDIDGQSLTITEIQGGAALPNDEVALPSGAIVRFDASGTLVYDPNGQFDGLLTGQSATDTFTYTVFDGLDGTSTATVTVTIDGLNAPPAIDLDGTAGGSGDVTLVYADTENRVAVAPLAIVSDVENEEFGTINIRLSGFVQGADEELIVGDATVLASVALSRSISIGAFDYQLDYDGASTITVTSADASLLSDAETEALIRSVTYDNTATADVAGDRVLEFSVTDAENTSPVARATITVLGSNKLPTPVADGSVGSPFLSGTEDTPISIDPAQLVLNDTDPEGDAFSITGYGNEVGGQIVIDATGAVTFVPDRDHEGIATFDYTVTDTFGGSADATVTLFLAGVNDRPLLDLDPASPSGDTTSAYAEDGPATPIVPGDAVLSDVDDTTLQAASVTFAAAEGDRLLVGLLPTGITAAAVPEAVLTGMTGAATVTLTLTGPASPADFLAALQAVSFSTVSDRPDTTDRIFEVVVSDGSLSSAPVRNVLTVTATNDAPVGGNDGTYTVNEDEELRLPISILLSNDTDPDGTNPTFAGLIDVTGGTANVVGGEIVFTPTPDANGPASLRYAISDGEAPDVIVDVAIDVRAVNDAPVLDMDGTTVPIESETTVSFTENGPATTLLAADFAISDVDNAQLGVAVVTLANGQPGDVLEYGALPPNTTVELSPDGPLSTAGAQTVTLSGVADIQDYRDWLASVGFRNTSEAPVETQREIVFQVSDGGLASNIATVRVDVTATNDAPVAVPDTAFDILEDGTLEVSASVLTGNDYDPDGETPTFVEVLDPVGGTVSVDASGNITFTPDADTSGTASFDYTIRDAAGETDTQTVTVNVAPVNDRPVIAHADSPAVQAVSYTEGDPAVPLVTGFALTDIDSATIAGVEIAVAQAYAGDVIEMAATVPGITLNAPAALVADGPLVVTLTGVATPAEFEAAVGALTFRSVSDAPSVLSRTAEIRATDGEAASDPIMLRIEVTEVNDLPDAPVLQPFVTIEDTPVSIVMSDLTDGPTDRDGDPLTVSSIDAVNGGTATIANGVVTFTPDADREAQASFDYTISDGRGGETTATAIVDIVPVDDAPRVTVGSGAAGPYVENGAPVALLDPALSVDDVDSGILDSALVQVSGFEGDVVSHSLLPAALSVDVQPSGALAGPGSIVVTITGPGSPAEYADALRALRFSSTSERPDETLREVQIAVLDASNISDVAISRLSVQAVNDAPVAGPALQLSTDEDVDLPIDRATLLGNVSDVDGDALAILNTSNVTGGTLNVRPDGSFVFVPTPDAFGPAGFDYTVADGKGGSVVARVDIDVVAVNDAPTLDLSDLVAGADYAFTYTEDDGPTAIVGADILVGDVDTSVLASATIRLVNGQIGDVLALGALPQDISASVVPSGPLTAPGEIAIYLTGKEIPSVYGFAISNITFRSASQSPSEIDRVIEVWVNDGTSDSELRRSVVSVVSVNDTPVAADDGFAPVLTTFEDTPIEFTPIANDTDADLDPLTVSSIAGTPVAAGGSVAVPDGRVTLLADGVTLRFEPRANAFGTFSFGYTVTDGQAFDDATVTIEVVSVNDAPILGADAPVALDEDTSAGFDPIANDTDVEGDPLRVATIFGFAAAPGSTVLRPEGEVRLGIDGRTITFTPALNWNGVFTVDYQVADSEGGTTDAALDFDVAPVNDPLTIVAQPPAVTYDDGAAVSLDMTPYLSDPDGDPILYTVTGLPAGLAINPDTGVIFGRLLSDASDTSPYTVTVRGDDRMGSTLDVQFVLTAVNTVPTGQPTASVTLSDGDIVAYAASSLFFDKDGDALTYTATGLPAWLSIGAATGEITGVVPFDASQAGPVAITITATDPAGAAATSVLTIVPINVAPVRNGAIEPLIADEGRAVEQSLAGFIRDGGRDRDVLFWTVTGLPAGVTFDPETLVVSGMPAEGTRRPDAYEVLVSADDGQGGVATGSFLFYVGDFSRRPDVFDFDQLPDAGVPAPVAPKPAPASLGFAAEPTDRSKTADLSSPSAIVTKAVDGVADLESVDAAAFEFDGWERRVRAAALGREAPRTDSPGLVEPIPTDASVAYVRDADGTIREIRGGDTFAAPRPDENELAVVELPTELARLTAPETLISERTAPAANERPVRVSARVAPGKVFVEARDPSVKGDPVRPVTITLRDGAEVLAEKVVRNGLMAYGVTPETLTLSLTVAVETADDLLAVRDVDVDVMNGSVSVVAPEAPRSEAPRIEAPRELPQYPPYI